MDMEQRKANWFKRVYNISPNILAKDISLIVSICQDAFNEGYKAATQERIDQDYANNRFT